MTESKRSLLGWARRAALGLSLFFVFIAVLAIRTVVSGHAALAEAERAFDRGALRESVRQARSAATYFVPFAPHVEAAYARLVVIARGAEVAGDLELAVFAWNATRAAAVESMAPGFERPELSLSNHNLARLAARLSSDRLGQDDGTRERELLRTFERREVSGASGLLFLASGLALLVAGLAWIGWLGLTRNGGISGRHLVAGAALVLIGAACWTLAAYRA